MYLSWSRLLMNMYIDLYVLMDTLQRINHVPRTKTELVTQGLSVLRSTSWAILLIPPSGTSSTNFNGELQSMSIRRAKSIAMSYLCTEISFGLQKFYYVCWYWLWVTQMIISYSKIFICTYIIRLMIIEKHFRLHPLAFLKLKT